MNDSSNDVQIVIKTISSEGIVMRNTKQVTEKGEEIKTTEYFLDLQHSTENTRNGESEYVTIDGVDTQFVSLDVHNPQELVLNDKEVIVWDDLCRICANSNEDNIPIFSGQGLENDLPNKIQKYLPLRISENDTLPQQICYNCAATLLSWHDLLKNCYIAQEKLMDLQSKLNFKEQFHNETSIDEDGTENIFELEAVNDDEDDFELALKEEEEDVEELKEGMEEVYEIEEKAEAEEIQEMSEEPVSNRFKCIQPTRSIDFRKINNQSPLVVTKSFKQSNEQSKQRSSRKRVAQEQFKPVATKKILLDKIKKNTKKTQSSIILKNKSFEIKLETIGEQNPFFSDVESIEDGNDDTDDDNNKNDIVEYEKKDYIPVKNISLSSDEKVVECKIRRRKRKGQDPTIPEDLTCKECKRTFRHPYMYVSHMRQHTGERPFACHLCPKAFSQPGSLHYHLKHVHEGIKEHACDICGRKFAMRSAMRDHRRIHTGEKPFCCDVCGKTFTAKASLYTHGKLHTDEYPFNCNYCQRSFRWKQQMVCHLTTHTKEKKHVCDVCGKAFGVKNELTRHMRTHSTEKPFSCPECTQCFGQKRYLRNHMRTRHKPKETDGTSCEKNY